MAEIGSNCGFCKHVNGLPGSMKAGNFLISWSVIMFPRKKCEVS